MTSDRWLRVDSGPRDALLNAFFSVTFRMLAERNWGIAMAVHPEYCSDRSFRHAVANGYFNAAIDLPRFETVQPLLEMFDHRIRVAAEFAADEEQATGVGAGAQELAAQGRAAVFEDGFESVLFECYEREDGNLRFVFTVADHALRETIGNGEPRITAATLREAALALGR